MKGVGLLNSHLTTLHHWLHFKGKSLWLLIHLEKYGYITVSLVGRIAIGASRSDFPDLVTQATCTNKTNMLFFYPVWNNRACDDLKDSSINRLLEVKQCRLLKKRSRQQ
jgi:hypothetical protein